MCVCVVLGVVCSINDRSRSVIARESRRAKGFGILGARVQVYRLGLSRGPVLNRRSLITNAQVQTTRSDDFKYTLQELLLPFGIVYKYTSLFLSVLFLFRILLPC